MKKNIKVAGLIPITLAGGSLQEVRGCTKTLNDLVCYLYCFLENCAYPGNTPQTTKTIGKMLQNAVFKDNILSFTFPKKIRAQFRLQGRYYLNLNTGSAYDFYMDDLLPQYKLACEINIEASGNEKKLALIKIQRLVLNSSKYVKSVSVKKYGAKYITIVKLKMEARKRIKIIEYSLNDSIYKLQEILL